MCDFSCRGFMKHSPVFVIGMHRSGSSALTSLLTKFGLYFGELDEGIGSSSQNAKGFWERRDVRNINDDILFSQKCDWDAIGSLNFKVLEQRGDVFDSIVNVEEKMNRNSRPYVIKEPRICLTLPIWKEALLIKPIYIFIHRNPLEIAASLKKRNGSHEKYWLELWYKYVVNALNNLKGEDVLFVSYEQLNATPSCVVDKISRFLSNKINIDQKPDDKIISEAISNDLRNQEVDEENVPERFKELNSFLRSSCSNDEAVYLDSDLVFPEVSYDRGVEYGLIFDKYMHYKNECAASMVNNLKLKNQKDSLEKSLVKKLAEIDYYQKLPVIRFYMQLKKMLKVFRCF
ncbi:sulfotransferase domain-containing protein [Aurantibacter sp.]|uniref:sulfotransferase family protein n=1 Tax=Aurantibacter sp. TaxID=2807103 RepID=UPI003265935F